MRWASSTVTAPAPEISRVPFFDIQGLSVLSFVSSLLLVLTLGLSYRLDSRHLAIRYWLLGSLLLAAGFLLIGLRHVLPVSLSIVATNMLLTVGACWLYFGMRATLGLPRGPRWDVPAGPLVAASSIYFTYVEPSLAARIAIISAVLMAGGILVTYLASFSAAARRDPDRPVLSAIGLGAFCFALVSGVRMVDALVSAPGGDLLAQTGLLHRLIFLAIILFNFTLIFGLTYLFSLRTYRHLRSSEDRFKALYEQATIGIGQFDIDGRWLHANRRLCDLLGYSESELLSRRFHDVTHPEDKAASEQDRTDLIENRRIEVIREKRYLRKDGSEIWARRSTTLVRHPDGTPAYFISVIEDISARKVAEAKLQAANAAVIEESERSRRAALNLMEDALAEKRRAEEAAARLQESEARFRALVEQSLAGIYIIQDGRFRYVNPGFAAIFGYDSAAEIVEGVSVADLVAPGDRERVIENIRRRVDGETGDIHYSFLGRRRDDRFIDVEVHGRRFDYEGRPAVIGIILDITARKAAEDALRESELRFHDIVRATADWVWEVDAEARYTYASESVFDFLGYTPQEILGKTPFELMPPDEAARVAKLFAGIVARHEPFRDLDNLNVRKDGSVVQVSTNGMPILDPDGRLLGYRGLDRDITEQKRAELELRTRNEELERFNRASVDRELDMIELKKTINALNRELDREPPFDLFFLEER